ncbi:MAG: MTH1187 family thiamine-binding protein [Candidatus Desulfofervidaceae bacterium]|nr:MTH1187 family thiamine-binding protein [Candidatus Desulfofervidaceae bacterium]MDL1971106.1 MTH1187 family thiamine-binding protein [Candidatus Desulfofervidaceae bacterium]
MAIVEVSVIPLGTKSTGVSNYVAAALRVLQKSGLKYQLTPMGTIIEGELDIVMPVVRQMHEACFKEGTARVVTTIKIDDRRDKPLTMETKVQSVHKKMEG